MNDLLAIDIFDDGTVPAGIGQGHMDICDDLSAGNRARHEREGLFLEGGNDFIDGREVVESVLRPD